MRWTVCGMSAACRTTCERQWCLPAEAKGCLKGAVVGGVAGHFMHRHTVLGAVAGCVIGHHMAVTKERQEKAQQKQQQAQHPNPQTH